jgi:hypothetical protein
MGRRLNSVRRSLPCSRGTVYSACMNIVLSVAAMYSTRKTAGGRTVISLAFCMD